MKTILGSRTHKKNDILLEAATKINANLVLTGILWFIAYFAFSLGPVMWVLLSELYPLKYRGLIKHRKFHDFFIFGAIALAGFFILLKILPENKGKSLEELEIALIK